MEETESSKPEKEEKEVPDAKIEAQESPEVLDKKIEEMANTKMKAWQDDLEKREMKMKIQYNELHNLADQLQQGGSGFATPQEPKKISDTEYAEALERGEVNPLEDDNIKIK